MLSAKVGKKSLNEKGDRGLSTSQSDLFGRKCRRFFGSHSENMAWFGFPAFYPYNLCGYFPGIFSIARYFTGKADAGIDKSIWRPAKPRKRATTRIRKTVARLRSKRIVANSQVKELPKMSNTLVNKKAEEGKLIERFETTHFTKNLEKDFSLSFYVWLRAIELVWIDGMLRSSLRKWSYIDFCISDPTTDRPFLWMQCAPTFQLDSIRWCDQGWDRVFL